MGKNCWEVMDCGREPGGARAVDLGICESTLRENYHGSNTGLNAGRCCWQVAGSLNGATGSCCKMPSKGNCTDCGFFKRVRYEEGGRFRL